MLNIWIGCLIEIHCFFYPEFVSARFVWPLAKKNKGTILKLVKQISLYFLLFNSVL